jgi:hypothetical protein
LIQFLQPVVFILLPPQALRLDQAHPSILRFPWWQYFRLRGLANVYAWPPFTGEELQVKFFGNLEENSLKYSAAFLLWAGLESGIYF